MNDFIQLTNVALTETSMIGDYPKLQPMEILKTYSFEQFEGFILEWATSFLKKGCHVLKRGGAGDKGIDILVSDQSNYHIFYQCKKYKNSFSLNDTLLEIGKICYYAYKQEIAIPTEYYLISSSDLKENAIKFFNNKDKIAEVLIKNWDQCCKTKIKLKQDIELDNQFRNYIEKFNFTNFHYKGISEVLNEHSKTIYFAFRFGGDITVEKPIKKEVPEDISSIETKYIAKLYDIYSIELKKNIQNDNDLKRESEQQYYKHFQKQRERFFSAESIKIFAKDNIVLENEFNKLKDEIYDTIFDSLFKYDISAYNKLDECLTKASSVVIDNNLLIKCGIINTIVRQGICHHLANEREDVKWKP